jgi:hypothetical protein
MFCSSKFNVNISDICSGVMNVRRAVDQYVEKKVEEHNASGCLPSRVIVCT